MSLFAFRNVATRDVPLSFNEAGDTQQHTITIRQLAPRHLEAAAKESQRVSFLDVRALGGFAALQKDLEGLKSADIDKAKSNPLLTYDRVVLIAKSMTAWSYGEAITEELIAELPEDWQVWAATEVLRLTRPALVQTKDEQETERKNAPASSSAL